MKKFIPLEEGDFYLSEEDTKYFQTISNLKGGIGVKGGCRHCPYGYKPKNEYNRPN